ncbi:MAG: MarR family transcriptional regulator [Arachnia sp.]
MPQTIIRHEEEHLYSAPPASEAGRALGAALLRLRRAQHAQELRALTSSGLSNLDLRALRYLSQAARDGRNLSPKDLAVMLGTSSANMTNIVDRLAGKGYVERINHPTDRRAHHLRPTDDALHLVDAALGQHHAAMVAEIDRIEDHRAAIAAAVLAQLADALDAASAATSAPTPS